MEVSTNGDEEGEESQEDNEEEKEITPSWKTDERAKHAFALFLRRLLRRRFLRDDDDRMTQVFPEESQALRHPKVESRRGMFGHLAGDMLSIPQPLQMGLPLAEPHDFAAVFAGETETHGRQRFPSAGLAAAAVPSTGGSAPEPSPETFALAAN